MRSINKNHGFTIMEMLIFIFLFGIVSTVIFTVFTGTQKTYSYNSKTVDLRQNLRATVDFLTGELMMAGSSGFNRDILEVGSSDTGLVKAARNTVAFTTDTDCDGLMTQVTFGLSAGDDANDDGLVDSASGTGSLVRVIDAGAEEIITEDIQAVQFAYAVDANNDNVVDFVDANADGQADSSEVIWAYDSNDDKALDTDIFGNALATNVSIDNIIMVRIWVLGRTSTPLKIPEDTRTYQLGPLAVSGGNDRFKRFLLATTVKGRNMGID